MSKQRKPPRYIVTVWMLRPDGSTAAVFNRGPWKSRRKAYKAERIICPLVKRDMPHFTIRSAVTPIRKEKHP